MNGRTFRSQTRRWRYALRISLAVGFGTFALALIALEFLGIELSPTPSSLAISEAPFDIDDQGQPEQHEAALVIARQALAEPEERIAEEVLIRAFRKAEHDADLAAELLGKLRREYAGVGPGKRAVLVEALARSQPELATKRSTASLATALWNLEEVEHAAASGARDPLGPIAATRSSQQEQSPSQHFLLAILFGLVAAAGVLAGSVLFRQSESSATRRRTEELFYSVAHDLKTPLANISLCAETLQEHGASDPAAIPRFSSMIRDEVVLLQGRIHQILQLAAGKIPSTFGKSQFDAASALPAIVAEYAQGARQSGVRLRLWSEGKNWLVDGSVELFAQSIGGLLENGIRHGAPGIVLVTAKRVRETLHVAVQDRGPGIPDDIADRVFEPFVTSGKQPREGTGLGLAIVRQSVEALGGSVSLDRSNPNDKARSTTFRIILPLADQSNDSATPHGPMGDAH